VKQYCAMHKAHFGFDRLFSFNSERRQSVLRHMHQHALFFYKRSRSISTDTSANAIWYAVTLHMH